MLLEISAPSTYFAKYIFCCSDNILLSFFFFFICSFSVIIAKFAYTFRIFRPPRFFSEKLLFLAYNKNVGRQILSLNIRKTVCGKYSVFGHYGHFTGALAVVMSQDQ